MKLSIIIPVFNEKNIIGRIIKLIDEVNLSNLIEKEIIIIDDGSTDGTQNFLKEINQQSLSSDLIIDFCEKNYGKGFAVRSGFQKASGDIILIQDADLEYSPEEYPKLIQPILDGRADVVYGSRFINLDVKQVLSFWQYFANKFLTMFSNFFTNFKLTDMETCYKVFTREVLNDFKDKLQSNRFGIEPEITAYIDKGSWRLHEVGISYHGRSYNEGKKVNWKDGLAAVWHIIKYNLLNR